MKIHSDCRPCLMRQVRRTALAAGADEDLIHSIEKAAARGLESAWDEDESPPVISTGLYRTVERMSGCDDPYLPQKITYTREALKLLPVIETLVENSRDPFDAAVRISIAGNVIDFGTGNQDGKFNLAAVMEEYLHKPIFHDDIPKLKESVLMARRILFLGDNAGETVFDRPLLSILPEGKVTYAAKGGAIINDATVADARLAGIHRYAELVSTGARTPGTIRKMCSRDFQKLFSEADLIISKGQGNFETLTEEKPDGRMFMLFIVKCDVAAEYLGGSVGDMVAMRW
ncbi:hypothetical protein BMS3Abin14_01669 [bacterium BMS3Abin14]|nr:hypothetical protein BMS3Abin14_01669 [bacterium BMS3Abin14]